MDVGFYYMANAMGRLLGTVLSGVIYQKLGLAACLFFSFLLILFACYFVRKIPQAN
jgi:predicted MFS family arabinose efflux permease